MNHIQINDLALANQKKAREILEESGIDDIWKKAGCRVNLIGSLRMADRIVEVMTQEQKDLILRLKFETPEGKDYHGVEYYEAVIADGITTMAEFEKWVTDHRKKNPYYWIP